MSGELDFPYHFSGLGRTATAGRDDHIRDLIEQVLFTAPGERVMRPDFGAGLDRLVFEPITTTTMSLVQHYAEEALITWEPRIDPSALAADGEQHLLLLLEEPGAIQPSIAGQSARNRVQRCLAIAEIGARLTQIEVRTRIRGVDAQRLEKSCMCVVEASKAEMAVPKHVPQPSARPGVQLDGASSDLHARLKVAERESHELGDLTQQLPVIGTGAQRFSVCVERLAVPACAEVVASHERGPLDRQLRVMREARCEGGA